MPTTLDDYIMNIIHKIIINIIFITLFFFICNKNLNLFEKYYNNKNIETNYINTKIFFIIATKYYRKYKSYIKYYTEEILQLVN